MGGGLNENFSNLIDSLMLNLTVISFNKYFGLLRRDDDGVEKRNQVLKFNWLMISWGGVKSLIG